MNTIAANAMVDEEQQLWTPPLLVDWCNGVKDIPAWVLEDWIPERGLVIMSGHEKKTKKTFTAMTQALAVATGKEIGPFKPSGDPRHVLFVEEEGTEADTRFRWQGICATYKVKLNKKLDVRFAFREGVGLDDARWRADLISYVDRFKPGVIFFDNLSFLHAGDDNSSEQMRPVIKTLKYIRDSGTATVVLAHLNKQHGGDPRADRNRQVRGTLLFVQNADVHTALRNYKGERDPIEVHRQYRGQAGKEDSFIWDIESEGIVIHKAALTMQPVINDEDPEFALMCLGKLTNKEYSLVQLQGAWKVQRRAALKIIHILTERDELTRSVTGHYSKG